MLFAGCAAGSALLASSAQAATINVTTTGDELAVDGDCSLREAVQSANKNGSFDECEKGQGDSRDTIKLEASEYLLTLDSTDEGANADGDLDYTGGGLLTVRGKGITATEIDAGPVDDRVLHARGNARSLTLKRLTVVRGNAPGPVAGSSLGGNLWVETGALTLDRVLVEAGLADVGGGVRFVSLDVDKSRNITVKHSIFDNNDAEDGAGLATNAIAGGATIVRHSVFSSNGAIGNLAEGGAIHSADDRLEVSDSLFQGNGARTDDDGTAFGGAISIDRDNARIERSTFSQNVVVKEGSSFAHGGAISATGLDTWIVNSTFWDNHSDGSAGALYGRDAAVRHSTFLANDADEEADHVAGIAFGVTLRGSILPGGAIAVDVCGDGGDVTSEGFNVFSYDDPDCGTLDSDVTNGGNAGLGTSPSDHGGPTPTISISGTSVAKNLIAKQDCGPARGEDQRGFERPAGPRCDAGAFEFGAEP